MEAGYFVGPDILVTISVVSARWPVWRQSSQQIASATGSEVSTWASEVGDVARLAFHDVSICRFLSDSRVREKSWVTT
jgi:hypothetical protein